MAAIFGVVAKSASVPLDDRAITQRMQARLAHRAPDGFAYWRRDGIVLGHGALHVGVVDAPVSQPLRLAGGRICVVDGFVANHVDVRRALGVDPGMDLDDARLLALAIQQWGERFHERVQGEFALALWDPAARKLVLYRDHLGARPLCYVETAGVFAFASESMALAELSGVSTQLNPLGIATMWYPEATYQDMSQTAFKDVHSLSAGHRLIKLDGQSPRLDRYWRMQPLEEIRLRDEGEYVDAFREVFGATVARAMRGSDDTALMLSGGIDSGAILAARRGFRDGGSADDLLCVSAVLAPGVDDPAAHAENNNILAMTAGHRHKLQFKVPVTPNRDGLVTSADLAETAWTWIHPIDMSLLVPSLACRLARNQGSRLMLNGIDGDNLTSPGVNYIDRLLHAGSWRHAWKESMHASDVNTYLRGKSPFRMLGRAVLANLEPASLHRLRVRRRTQGIIRGMESHPVMAPALAQRANLARRLHEAQQLRQGDRSQLRCDHLAYWLAFSMQGSNHIMSRHGMEVRHPWCDRQLLEFFQRLPVEYLTRNGWTKYLVRKACEPALGARVVWHSGKSHHGAWLRQQVLQEAAPYLRDMLMEQRPRLGDYVRDEAIIGAVRWLERKPFAEPEFCDTVLTIVSLAGWLRYVHSAINRG